MTQTDKQVEQLDEYQFRKKVGQRIRQMMDQRGMTYKSLEADSGIPYSTIRDIVNGRYSAKAWSLYRIHNALQKNSGKRKRKTENNPWI